MSSHDARSKILARRARFVAAAFTSAGLLGCGSQAEACLSAVAIDAGDDATAPEPCLGAPLDTGVDTQPQPCLTAPLDTGVGDGALEDTGAADAATDGTLDTSPDAPSDTSGPKDTGPVPCLSPVLDAGLD